MAKILGKPARKFLSLQAVRIVALHLSGISVWTVSQLWGSAACWHWEDPLGFSLGQTSPCPTGHNSSQNTWQWFLATYRCPVAEGAGCPCQRGMSRKLCWMLVLTPWEAVTKVWSASETPSVPSGCLSHTGLQPQDYLAVQFAGRDWFRNKSVKPYKLKSKSLYKNLNLSVYNYILKNILFWNDIDCISSNYITK